MIAPARVAAFEILSSLSEGRADLPAAVARARRMLSDERDQALAADIATGVQRWRAALDHVIAACSRRSIERLDPEVVDILRLSAYQLLHLTRVPAAAVVDDAVDLARRAGKGSASGFVNAVLRTISRRRTAPLLPPRPADPADRSRALDYLSISLSHPRWIAARWYDRFGFEATERWMQFDNSPASLTLRANPLRLAREELVARLAGEQVRVAPGRFAPDALVVEAGRPLGGRGLEEGWFVVQDEASQLVSLLAGPTPGARVLDACAAPGGKTTALAAAMRGRGLLVACDLRARRIGLLRRTVTSSGATNVRLVRADLLKPLPFPQVFDCVLVDAPCSGLGTLRRDPDIRWRRREADLNRFAESQHLMLRQASGVVAIGGRLVYATCSSEPEENEIVVESFLSGSPHFRPVDPRREPTGLPAGVIDEHAHLRTYPHVHGLEAFFGAVFVRHA